jgi:hypothetical protein
MGRIPLGLSVPTLPLATGSTAPATDAYPLTAVATMRRSP